MIKKNNKRKSIFLKSFIIFLLFFFLPNQILLAQEEPPSPSDYESELIEGTPILEKGDILEIVFNIIQYLLSFLGVIAVCMIIYSGYLWMTAGGNEEKVGKAKKTLTYALVGLLVILFAYTITAFVISRLHGLASFQPK